MDLTKILQNAPEGFKLYSTIHGEVELAHVDNYKDDNDYPIITYKNGRAQSFTKDGRLHHYYDGECILFPQKDQRDWNKFTAPWYNEDKKDVKDRFDPKTLNHYDKIIVRDIFTNSSRWVCSLFSHYDERSSYPCRCVGAPFSVCIPYNDDTKHLVGTTEEAPEYYRYWED